MRCKDWSATTVCVERTACAIGVGTGVPRWTSGSGSGRVRCRRGWRGWRVGWGSRPGSARPPTCSQETLRVDVATESVRRVTEGIGAVAEAEQQAAITLAQAGQAPTPDANETAPSALVVEVDGVHVHAGGDWHEMKVGLVAPLGPATRTRQGDRPRRAHARSAERVRRVRDCRACSGIGSTSLPASAGSAAPELALVVVLGDGADWIWRYAWQFLGRRGVEVVEIVDIFHAWGHLWTVANAVFGAGTARAAAWVEPLKVRLLDGRATPDPRRTRTP